jgi:very-short-patch-repair endonuclease
VSAAEELFAAALVAGGLPAPVREHRFHPVRRFRFDFAWVAEKLAVEIEGKGRHQTFMGFANDAFKYNLALALGWRVLRFPAAFVKPGRTRKLWPGGAAEMVEDVRSALSHALQE